MIWGNKSSSLWHWWGSLWHWWDSAHSLVFLQWVLVARGLEAWLPLPVACKESVKLRHGQWSQDFQANCRFQCLKAKLVCWAFCLKHHLCLWKLRNRCKCAGGNQNWRHFLSTGDTWFSPLVS